MKTIRKLLFLLLVLISAQSSAQIAPYEISLDSVEYWVKDSPEVIPNIVSLSLNPDSVLDMGGCFLLYYGSAYHEAYSPYTERGLVVAIYEMMEQDSLEIAKGLCQSMIEEHPGFLRPYYFLGRIYEMQGDTTKANNFYTKFFDLLSIPFFSGSGNSFDSAYIVRSIDDEYIIIGELGYDMQEQALFEHEGIPYDVLYTTSLESGETRDFYFNIYQPYRLGMSWDFPDEEIPHNEKKQRRLEKKEQRKNKKAERKNRKTDNGK